MSCQHKRVFECNECLAHVCNDCGEELPVTSRELLATAKVCNPCRKEGKTIFLPNKRGPLP